MIYQILQGKSVLFGIVFFFCVFTLGLLWSWTQFGGLADTFLLK